MLDQSAYKVGDLVRRITESHNPEQYGVYGEVYEIVYDDLFNRLKPEGLHYGVSNAAFELADAPDTDTFKEGDEIYYGFGGESPRRAGKYVYTTQSGKYVVHGKCGVCYADTIRTRYVATVVIGWREYSVTQEQLDAIEEVLS